MLSQPRYFVSGLLRQERLNAFVMGEPFIDEAKAREAFDRWVSYERVKRAENRLGWHGFRLTKQNWDWSVETLSEWEQP